MSPHVSNALPCFCFHRASPMRMEVSGSVLCPHSLEESYPGQLSRFHKHSLTGRRDVLACEAIRKKEQLSVLGPEEVHIPRLVCLLLQGWFLDSPFVVFYSWPGSSPSRPVLQVPCLGLSWKAAPPGVLTLGPGPW